MALNKIKLIAFDLDGTLLDSVPDLAFAVNKALEALGFESVTEEQVGVWLGNGADILLGRSISRSMTIDPELAPELREKGRKIFDKAYEECGHSLSHLYPTVFDTLTRLKQAGYIMAVITNKPSMFVPEVLEQQKIKEMFDDVIGGEDFPKRKPDPVALNWLLDKYGLSADEMLMVGDSRNDILAARNAGCHCFGLTYGYNHGEPISASEPDFIANEMAELLNILPEEV